MSDNINLINLHNKADNILLTETEPFHKVLESNPLLIVNDSCEVMFSNNSFQETFHLDKAQDFFELTTEPDIQHLLKILSGNNYRNFESDLFISPGNGIEENHYSIELERIILVNQKYNTIILKSLKEKSGFEERINNLHIALEYGKIPVIIVGENGIIKYATSSFERILKLSIEEIFNRNVSEALSLYLTTEERKILDKLIIEKKEWSKTISCSLENGVLEYHEIKLKPVYKGGEGLPGFILTANDITDYILKNIFMKKSETRLKSIINNISDLLLIFQKRGNEFIFENANDNFCKIFSIDKNKAVNKKLNSSIDVSFFLQLQFSVQEFNVKDSSVVEFNYRSPKNKAYSAKITFIHSASSEDILYILSMQDITDQVLYREQLEKAYEKEINLNNLKTAFLENMSHEIRTPFNAILGYSDIIDDCLKDNDYETIWDLMSSIKDVLNRVLKLFTNIVEVFQISSGEMEIEYVSLNINQVLKAVYNNRIQEVRNKNLEFKLVLYKNDLIVRTDWIKFENIINSLVDNAIKYTEEGNIELCSGILKDKIEIIISDTGKGIKTDNIRKLYEPFVQEEKAYFRNYEGAGLGLTIAYKLTQLMGGTFDIRSEENKGTKIILTFPSGSN